MARIDIATAIARIDEAAFSAAPLDRLVPLALEVFPELLGKASVAVVEERTAGEWVVARTSGFAHEPAEQLGTPRPIELVRARLRQLAEHPAWEEVAVETDPGYACRVIVGWSGDKTMRPLVKTMGAALRLAWTRVTWTMEQRRRDSGKGLVALGNAVAGGLDLPSLFRLATETALLVAEAHEVWIFGVGDAESTALELRHTSRKPASRAPDSGRVDREAAEIALRAHRRRVTITEQGDRCFAAIPIRAHKPFGALVALRESDHNLPPRPYGEWELMRLTACASYLASAQQATEMLTDQQRSVRELVLLNEVARDCAKLGLDGLIPAVCERICRSLPVDGAGLYFADTERREIVWGGGSLLRGRLPLLRIRLPLTAPSIAARAFTTRHARRGGVDEVVSPEMQHLLESLGLFHIGAIPLAVKDRAIGVLMVARKDEISDEQMRLLDAIGAEMAVALDNSLLYSEVTRRADDLAAVQDIGEAMARSLDPDLIVRETGMKLCRALESDGISIYARRSRGFEPLWRHGLVPERELGRAVPDSDTTMARVLETNEPVDLPPSQLEDPAHPFISVSGIGRVAVAPLLGAEQRGGGQRVIHTGAILIGRRAARPYGASELRILGAVAAQLAVALDNAELYEQTRRRADDLALVGEAARALLEGTPPEEALAPVVVELTRQMRVEASAIALIDPVSRELTLAACSRPIDPAALPLAPDGFVARAIRQRTPQATEHPWALALPMSSDDQTLGALVLCDSHQARALSPAEQARARAIGDQVAAAIERAELHARLRKSLQELDNAQAQLVRRERLAALGELAALVAHEVRNPLGVIISSLGTLTKITQLDGDARRIYEIMVQESGRLDRIVSDMLDYTRPTVLRLALGSLPRALRDAVESATASERARGTPVDGIRVIVKADDTLPRVPMDDRLLHQAFVNLLSNAFQSIPREGGRVDIEASVSEDGRAAQIVVEDNGQGIPAEVRQRLFEPFFTTKAKGSGLGLAMVKRIIDGHGGEILVETEPGAGTRFVVRLPLSPVSTGLVIAREPPGPSVER